MTGRELLERALVAEGSIAPSVASVWTDHIAATPSGAELIRRADAEPVLRAALDGAYSERNRLVAALIKVGGYPAVTWEDQAEPGWWVVYVDTPSGQLSWHVGPSDIGLFLDVPSVIGESPWDGHDTDEKYRRLAALTTPDAPG